MINQMRNETVQFQEEQLVLQEGAALKSGADVLLVGIEQKRLSAAPIIITIKIRKPGRVFPEARFGFSRSAVEVSSIR